ncbi:MAG: hypothetical protein GX455_12270 [Phycisphaerae bacterium]|nr:hypothetical protein [Phycisphaerae bacterium]
MEKLLTVKDIAYELGISPWKVEYLLRRNHLVPVIRIGNIRGFEADTLEIVRERLLDESLPDNRDIGLR